MATIGNNRTGTFLRGGAWSRAGVVRVPGDQVAGFASQRALNKRAVQFHHVALNLPDEAGLALRLLDHNVKLLMLLTTG